MSSRPRDHEDRLEPRSEMAVHERHLKFVLEVTRGAETTDDQRGSDGAREICQQSIEASHGYTGRVAKCGLE